MNETTHYSYYLAAYASREDGSRGSAVGRFGTVDAPTNDYQRAAWALGLRDAEGRWPLRVKWAVDRAVARMMGDETNDAPVRVGNAVLVKMTAVSAVGVPFPMGGAQITITTDADFDPMIFGGARRLYLSADNRTDEEVAADELAHQQKTVKLDIPASTAPKPPPRNKPKVKARKK